MPRLLIDPDDVSETRRETRKELRARLFVGERAPGALPPPRLALLAAMMCIGGTMYMPPLMAMEIQFAWTHSQLAARRAVWRGIRVPGEAGEWIRGERSLVDAGVMDEWRAREWKPRAPGSLNRSE